MFRMAHLADLGMGAIAPAVVEATLADLQAYAPDLIVVSGNLTRRATAEQFKAARLFLDRLPAPGLVVPGPRDASGFSLFGMLDALRKYRGAIGEDLLPVHSSESVVVLGIDTSRKGGRLTPAHAAAIRSRLGSSDRVTVLASHHPLVPRPTGGATVAQRSGPKDLQVVAKCVDLVLAGHHSVGSTQDTRVAYRILDRQAIVAQAAHAPASAKGGDKSPYYNGVTIDGDQLSIAVRLWRRGGFEEQGPKSYRFDGARWEKHVDVPPDFEWSDASES
jgi:3',5'-cyclic AMP phosphodiesterase CpdA